MVEFLFIIYTFWLVLVHSGRLESKHFDLCGFNNILHQALLCTVSKCTSQPKGSLVKLKIGEVGGEDSG